MKTLEELGLEQMNQIENENVNGGRLYPWEDVFIVCCYDIPPMSDSFLDRQCN